MVPDAETMSRFKKAYPSAAAMGSGFPAFGADAVRFTLATYPPSNKRIALAPKRIEGNRHFLNKIWNATRLALDLLGDFSALPDPLPLPKGFVNRWIRSRFAAATEVANAGIDAFRIDEAALASYRFFWNELCDWYLELVKPVLRKQEGGPQVDPTEVAETRETLAYVLEGSLRLMHPMMPFITEELWQRIPRPTASGQTIALAAYPTAATEGKARAPEVDAWMDILQSVVSAARTVRSEHEVKDSDFVPVRIRSGSAEVLDFLRGHEGAIRVLVRTAGAPHFEAPGGPREPGTTVSVVPASGGRGPIEVLVGLRGLVEPGKESARIEREMKRIEKDLAAVEKKLGSPGFTDRAPPEVVAEARDQRASLIEAKERLAQAKKLVGEL
jgi:valyl-tRNA synthetase